jgi:hypothetical protein
MLGKRLEFVPGFAGVEAAKLKKFSDADGTQSQWLPDAGRTDCLNHERYTALCQPQDITA